MNYLTEKTYHSTIYHIGKVVSSMANSIRLTVEEYKLAIDYAKRHSMTLGEAFKQALFERIEDEYDLKVAEEAYKNYVESGYKSTPAEDFWRELDAEDLQA